MDKGPQTPVVVSESNIQSDDIEVVTLWEESLVEARLTWDLRKTLGLKTSNELAVIEALAKGSKCLNFVIMRKWRRPRKKKGCS